MKLFAVLINDKEKRDRRLHVGGKTRVIFAFRNI